MKLTKEESNLFYDAVVEPFMGVDFGRTLGAIDDEIESRLVNDVIDSVTADTLYTVVAALRRELEKGETLELHMKICTLASAYCTGLQPPE